jgi:NTP pyrophosphatase (non-canonical NTP hydrolase)
MLDLASGGGEMSELLQLTELAERFRDERDWKQFHNLKDMVVSLQLESSELLEMVQWRSGEALDEHFRRERDQVGDELADILYWILLIARRLDIDLSEAFKRKMRKNEEKYPVAESRGSAEKHDRLRKR